MKIVTYSIFLLSLMIFSMESISAAPPISLVWQTNREKAWEEDWLSELLTGVDLKVVDDGNFKKYINNSIIVISAWQNHSKCNTYFQKLHKKKYKFGIIVLSDERYIIPKELYKHASFVFRNYWHHDFLSYKQISIFPLGYKNGFWRDGRHAIKPADQRQFIWSFAGQINRKPNREEMLNQLKVFPNHFMYETFAWADPNALDAISYRNVLLDTIFAPSPIGWINLDSFRLYEALECGCIPIVQKGPDDYFKQYFGSHPFIVIDTWDQAPELMRSLIDNPALLEQRRIECYEWWQAHKKMLNEQWTNIIRNTFI